MKNLFFKFEILKFLCYSVIEMSNQIVNAVESIAATITETSVSSQSISEIIKNQTDSLMMYENKINEVVKKLKSS